MSEYSMLGEVLGVVSGGEVESIVQFKGGEDGLLLQVSPGFLPYALAFVGLIDDVFADGHFLLVDEGGQLIVNQRDEVGWELPCEVYIFQHLGLQAHFSIDSVNYRIIIKFYKSALLLHHLIIANSFILFCQRCSLLESFFAFYNKFNFSLMSLDRERPIKQNVNNSGDSFALQISRKDQIKILKKKQSMLKDAIGEQRRKKSKLTQQLTAIEDKLKKYQFQNKKKEEKNEALMAEIKSLKDLLIVERNQKQKCMDQLQSKLGSESGKQPTSKTKLDSSRYFGLRALFQK